jgi:hypothetical protein
MSHISLASQKVHDVCVKNKIKQQARLQVRQQKQHLQ